MALDWLPPPSSEADIPWAQSHEDILSWVQSKIEQLWLWEDTKALVEEEYQEMETALQRDRGAEIGISQYEREDLMSEFGEDLQAMSVLERDFSDAEWYKEFIALLQTDEVSDEEEEALYDIVINEREAFDEYIDFMLDGEMFPDAEELQDFLLDTSDTTHDDEIQELQDIDIVSLSPEELAYVQVKIQGLIDSGIWKSDIRKLQEIEKQVLIRQEDIKQSIVVEDEKGVIEEEKDVIKEWEKWVEEKLNNLDTVQQELQSNANEFLGLYDTLWIEKDTDFEDIIIKLGKETDTEALAGLVKTAQDHLTDNPQLIEDLLLNAKSKSGTTLKGVQKFLWSVAKWNDHLENTIKEFEIEHEISNMSPSEIRDRQMRAYFGGEGNFDVWAVRIDGDTYNFGDMQVDASSKPPQAFVVWWNDLKLELGLPDLPNDVETRKARREFAQSKIALNEEFQENTEESHDIIGKLQRLQQLEDNKENLSTEDAKEYQSLKWQESVLRNRLETLEFDKEKLIVKSAKLSQNFENYLKTLTFDYNEVHEKQDRARFGMALMTSFGIERVGQDRFNQVVAEIQNGHIIVDLQSPNGFDPQKIDIAGGHFWEVRGDPGWENFRENLAMFVNLMYFGNTEWNNATGEPVWLNVDVYRRASEIENIPWQDPGLASNMDASGILTSTGDLNIDLARVNLKKKVL